MGILFADTDAKFRNDILSNTRHMIERFRGATAYLTRELENVRFLLSLNQSVGPVPQERNQELLDEISNLLQMHEIFIQWYLKFLSGELIPTASYQRHITALKAIALLLRSGIVELDPSLPPQRVSDDSTIWPFTIKFFTLGTMRLILDLLMDPFEDVRVNATVVLKLASRDDFRLGNPTKNSKDMRSKFSQLAIATRLATAPQSSDSQQLPNSSSAPLTNHAAAPPQILLDFIDLAQDIAKRTGRADYADGVARSYEILYGLRSSMEARLTLVEDLVDQLELKVNIAEEDLAQAVLEAPIHGSFAALKYVYHACVESTTNTMCAAMCGTQLIIAQILMIRPLKRRAINSAGITSSSEC